MDTPEADRLWLERLRSAVNAGQISREQALDAWCADSYALPDAVKGVTVGERSIRINARGRRVPVVGEFDRIEGRTVVTPKNRNGKRHEDLGLIASVAELIGLPAEIRPHGRPVGGVMKRAVAHTEGLVSDGTSLAEAARIVAPLYRLGEPLPGNSEMQNGDLRRTAEDTLKTAVHAARRRARSAAAAGAVSDPRRTLPSAIDSR